MGKLPEDIRLALDGLAVLEEKFLHPLGRLRDVIRLCVDSENRIADAQGRYESIQATIAETERKALQQLERNQTRLKTMSDQFVAVQAQWVQEESAHKEKVTEAEQRIAQLQADYSIRCQRRDQLAEENQEAEKRLEDLRHRIKRAQTMEP